MGPKVQSDKRIMSETKVIIEGSTENKSLSTLGVDQKYNALGHEKSKNGPEYKSKEKL